MNKIQDLMGFKTILFDVDGTLIQNTKSGILSENVCNAINNSRDKINIGVATARPLSQLTDIFGRLNLSAPCIINGGAQIINPQTLKNISDQPIEMEDCKLIIKLIISLKLPFWVNDGGIELPYSDSYIPKNPYFIYLEELQPDLADSIILTISKLKNINIHKIIPHDKSKMSLGMTHKLATKEVGVKKVAKFLNTSPKWIVGIGDGYNDIPLLNSCGLKVAMGNAIDEVKRIADLVIPSVEEDGAIFIINKLTINQ